MNTPTEEEFPADISAAMLADVVGREVEPAVSARIKARALDRIRKTEQLRAPERPGFIDVLADAGWQVLAPGVEMKVLFEDHTARSWMVRLQAGSELPPHEHDEVTRDRERELGPVVVFHQGQRQIDPRRDTRRRPHRAVSHVDGLGLDRHFREFARQGVAVGKVRGGAPPVQQARRGQHERAGAHGSHAPHLARHSPHAALHRFHFGRAPRRVLVMAIVGLVSCTAMTVTP